MAHIHRTLLPRFVALFRGLIAERLRLYTQRLLTLHDSLHLGALAGPVS